MSTSTFPATRASTLAKALDDKGGLMDFHAATTLQQIARTPTLRQQMALVKPADDLDWRAFKPLVTKAQTMRGKPEADAGTNIHSVVEAIVRGQSLDFVDAALWKDARAVLGVLEGLGLTPVGAEEFVYLAGLPEPTAGTRDLRCAPASGGPHVIIDTKSTTDLAKDSLRLSGVSWAIQLAVYALGSPYPTEGLVRDRWGRPMIDPALVGTLERPAVSASVGVVVEVARGTGEARPHIIDLEAGYSLAEEACRVRAARKVDVAWRAK
jgi:hypothetical protein